MVMVHDLSLSQHAMWRLSPSVTRKEYEQLLWMVHDLSRTQEKILRLHDLSQMRPFLNGRNVPGSCSITPYDHLFSIMQRHENILMQKKNKLDSCSITQSQYDHLLSTLKRHEDILALVKKENEPAARGRIWSMVLKVDKVNKKFRSLPPVNITESIILLSTIGTIALVGLYNVTGKKSAKMVLDEKLVEIPGRVDSLDASVETLEARVETLEHSTKAAPATPYHPPLKAMSPLKSFALTIMEQVRANSKLARREA